MLHLFKVLSIIVLITKLVLFNNNLYATVYRIFDSNSRIIGKNISFIIPLNNKCSLEYFSAKFQVGITNMLEANPNLDVYLPTSCTKIIVPKKMILPNTLHKGIIINSAEMRLYFFLKKNKVIVFPIGIGEIGNETPKNWITSVKYKKSNPIWIPTKNIRDEYIRNGQCIPKIFPAGPNNPMGLFALYLGNYFAIHGTNSKFGIGLRISHGCVRLRDDDIKFLFENVPVGTRVQFINEPIKITKEPDNIIYLEVHQPLSSNKEEFMSKKILPIKVNNYIKQFIINNNVNIKKFNNELNRRSGIPVIIN
ncbi:MAG: L,D-transpeptidase family protein [Candidatus Lightella neohaematopini]|nr:L,D-transpeptidase family protein [Candidatus Lightella neohaematopini]